MRVSFGLHVGLGVFFLLGCQRRRETPPSVEVERPAPPPPTPRVAPAEGQEVQPSEMTPESVAGVYAVRRTTQTSSCSEAVVGDVLSTVWVLDALGNPRAVRMAVYGSTVFTRFSSSIHANTLELVASSDHDQSTTMTVVLSPANVRQLQGSETIAMRRADGSRCLISRAVNAARLN